MDTLYLDITDSTPKEIRHVERVMVKEDQDNQLLGLPPSTIIAIAVPVALFVIGMFILRRQKRKQRADLKKKRSDEMKVWTGKYLQQVSDRASSFKLMANSVMNGDSLPPNPPTNLSMSYLQTLSADSLDPIIHPNGTASMNGRFEHYLEYLDAIQESEQVKTEGELASEEWSEMWARFNKDYKETLEFIHTFFSDLSTNVSEENPPDSFLLKLFEIRNEWYVLTKQDPQNEMTITFESLFTPIKTYCEERIQENPSDPRPFQLQDKIDRVLGQREQIKSKRKRFNVLFTDVSEKLIDCQKQISKGADYLF